MEDQKYPEPTVGDLIFNQNGDFLLVKSNKWLDKYVIPGGHIELGETIEQALIREAKEETGLDVYDISFIGFQEFIMDNAFYKKKHFIFLDYACKTASSKVILNSEAESYIWATLSNISQLEIEPYTKRTIEKYYQIHNH